MTMLRCSINFIGIHLVPLRSLSQYVLKVL